MPKPPHVFIYNAGEHPHSTDWPEHATALPHSRIDQTLIDRIGQIVPAGQPLLLFNGACVWPQWGLERMRAAWQEIGDADVLSALSCEITALSPLALQQSFRGTVAELDQLIYALQSPGLFDAPVYNPHCAMFRGPECLATPPHRLRIRACNNLLVQPPGNSPLLRLSDARHRDSAHTLPAHPLGALHLKLRAHPAPPDQALGWPGLDGRPVLLHIYMNWGGGVARWINDHVQQRPEFHHLVLSSQGSQDRRSYGERLVLRLGGTEGVQLERHDLAVPIDCMVVEHTQYDALFKDLLERHQVAAVVVSSLIGHSAQVLASDRPTVRVLHDYFPHWPALTARLDADEIGAAEWDAAFALSRDEPFGGIDRDRHARWCAALDDLYNRTSVTLVAPSRSVQNNFRKITDGEFVARMRVLPHQMAALPTLEFHANKEPFTVLVPGRISLPKGQRLLEAVLATAPRDFRFVLLGAGGAGRAYARRANVEVVHNYALEDLPDWVDRLQPQIALLTSLASETHCYTLSEMQALGVPVLAVPSGAIGERIEAGRTGWLCDADAAALVAQLQSLAGQREALLKVHQNLHKLNQQPVSQAKEWAEIYRTEELQPAQLHYSKDVRPEPLTRELQLAEAAHKKTASELRRARKDVRERTDWAHGLQQHNEELGRQIVQERAQIEHLKNVVTEVQAAAEQDLQHHKGVIAQQNQRIDEAQKRADDAENKFNEIIQSHSWRVTRPMRVISRFLRRRCGAAVYRARRWAGLPGRVLRSLRSRGLKQTLHMARQKLRRSAPPKSAMTQPATPPQQFDALQVHGSKTPRVSVVVPVYNSYAYTHQCLASLAALQDDTPFEVIVVNDASTDDTEKLIARVSGIRCFHRPQNQGFIESCLFGAEQARGEYLLFLNNDTVVHDDWLDALLRTFETHPDAGLVGSKLVYPDGRLQEAGGIVFSDASGWNYGRLQNPDEPAFNHLREVSYCSGASILVPRALFDQLGGFDRRYKPAYYEDTDLAFAVREAGLKVYYQPASVVTHFEGVSSGTDLSSGTKKYQVVNQQKFLQKWSEALARQPAPGSDIEMARLQNRPRRVAIFDACTPTPDQDSGSLRMFNLMQIFQALGYHVSFIPENMAHFGEYTAQLQGLGVECIYAPTHSNPVEYLHTHGAHFDVVFLSRYYVAEPLLAAVKKACPKARVLFDTVDLHYLREQRMAELENNPALLKSAAKTRRRELAVMRGADITLVVSPHEVEELKREDPSIRVEVLSNIHEVYGCTRGFAARSDLLFMGGYQHTPNVDAVHWLVDDIWPAIHTALPDATLHLIGSKAPAEVQALGDRDGVKFHGFVADIEPFMQNIRIALAPLRYGAGVKGKVNMSMSYGQPVVGTRVAVEGMHTVHEKDVLIAENALDFAAEVVRLYHDAALWQRLSEAGLENVQRWFSFAAAKNRLAELLSDAPADARAQTTGQGKHKSST